MTSLSHPAALATCAQESVAQPRDAQPAQREIVRMSAVERMIRTLILWHHRSRSRADLRALDDRLLSDIGLDRETAQRVAAKRFWQD